MVTLEKYSGPTKHLIHWIVLESDCREILGLGQGQDMF